LNPGPPTAPKYIPSALTIELPSLGSDRLHEDKLKSRQNGIGIWADVSFESFGGKLELASVMAVLEKLRLGDTTRSHV
jgi:hypothetical protein